MNNIRNLEINSISLKGRKISLEELSKSVLEIFIVSEYYTELIAGFNSFIPKKFQEEFNKMAEQRFSKQQSSYFYCLQFIVWSIIDFMDE